MSGSDVGVNESAMKGIIIDGGKIIPPNTRKLQLNNIEF
jgi:hypothetical protein